MHIEQTPSTPALSPEWLHPPAPPFSLARQELRTLN